MTGSTPPNARRYCQWASLGEQLARHSTIGALARRLHIRFRAAAKIAEYLALLYTINGAGSWRLRLGQVLRLYQRLPRSQTPSPSCLAVQSRIRRRMHTLDIESCSFSPSANHGARYPQCRLGNRQLENFQSVALRVPRPRLSPGWSPSAGFGCAPAGSGSGALSVPHSLSRSPLPRPPPPPPPLPLSLCAPTLHPSSPPLLPSYVVCSIIEFFCQQASSRTCALL